MKYFKPVFISQVFFHGVLLGLFLCLGNMDVAAQSGGLPKMRYEPVLPLPDHAPQRITTEQPVVTVDLATRVLIPELKGILFVDSVSKIKLIAPDVAGVQYDLDRQLAFAKSTAFRNIVNKYIDKPFSLADLTQLQEEIQRLYKRNDLPVIGVFAPNQDVASGTIQIVVMEGRIGDVRFQGNDWFRSKDLYAQMNSRSGKRIHESILNEDLRWLNRSAFRDVTVELLPPNDNGYCDLNFRVEDDFPIRSSIGYMDNGTESTGIERVQVSLTHGNLWKRDHIFNYTYNATPNFKNVQVHMGSYMIPFKNRDTLSVYGYYGTMIPELPAQLQEVFNLEGKVWQTSARYSKLLGVKNTKNTRREQRFSFGGDFKQTNSNLDFGGLRVSETAAQLAQLTFGYSDSFIVNNKGYIGLDANLFWSPGKWARFNNDTAFQNLRLGSKANYVYANVNLMAIRYLNKKFQWNVRATGQWSDTRLLPIEQLGLGGDYSVRGYNTYAANADSGWVLSNELATRFKPLGFNTLLQHFPPYHSVRKVDDEYQLFTFVDAGGGWNKGASEFQPFTLEHKYQSLCGAGLGARYNFGPWIRLEAAYGWQLKDLDNNDYKDRAHVSIVISR